MKLRQNGTVSFMIRLDARGQRRRSCETTPKWHGFLMIKLAAQAASGRAEQRTAEYRISNRRISKDGFAALSLFLNRQNTSLRHSIFIIRYSLFQSFFYDQTGRFVGQRRRSYETTPKWHDFLMIKLAVFQASGWAET
jgi:hypothetical protein